jgi:hypothetical protein
MKVSLPPHGECRAVRPLRRTLLPVTAVLSVMSLSHAAAAIECRGEFQVVQGQELSTPYCQDNYLARIARSYGSRVSAREIRNNPNTKAEVCRFMGHDSRVSHICQPYRDNIGRTR